MNGLVLRGKMRIDNMEFNHIEGGFGEDKKAMLVKDIAQIHGRELREINERININRKRFKNGIDIIDLLGVGLNDTEIKQFGFTQQAINSYRGLKAKGYNAGIYVLSERGYSKLLKILEDDFAWEQYEKLVDGYFNMRKAIRNDAIDMIKQQEIEARLNNSRARQANILLKIANDTDIKEYKQVLHSYASKIVTGEQILPLPTAERKTYSATEIGEILGITANMVGRLANAHGLKTEEYGKLFYDKSAHSNKQVETFRYYDNVIPVLEKLSKGAC